MRLRWERRASPRFQRLNVWRCKEKSQNRPPTSEKPSWGPPGAIHHSVPPASLLSLTMLPVATSSITRSARSIVVVNPRHETRCRLLPRAGGGFGAIYFRSLGLQVRYALCILLMARAFNAHRDRIPMKKNIMAAALCTRVNTNSSFQSFPACVFTATSVEPAPGTLPKTRSWGPGGHKRREQGEARGEKERRGETGSAGLLGTPTRSFSI